MSDAIEENAASEAASPEVATPVAAPTDEVAVKLREFNASDEVVDAVKALGVDTVADLSLLTADDLVGAGLKLVKARKLLDAVKPPEPVVAEVDVAVAANFEALPSVPDDGSWLDMLKTGGVLKVDQSTIISTIRAALAQRVGLFNVPAKLAEAMEEFADRNDEPVDPSFFKLRKQLTKRSYAEVFEAIEGLDGTFVTEARKKELFKRMDQNFWPALLSFQNHLNSWYDTWVQSMANPQLFMAALAKGQGVVLPPGMSGAPPADALRDAADAVADAVNRVFAGTGVPVASAMAYDAVQIRKSLEDPRVPALIGAANRDQMLKQLGVSVPATYPRLETNLTRFVISVVDAKNQAAGVEEQTYFGALYLLGTQIDWTQLGVRADTISRLGRTAVRSSVEL